MIPRHLLAGIAFVTLAACGDRADNAALTLYGNVDTREVQLAFRVAGRIDEVTVDEGARVAAGDVLAVLDGEPYELQLAAGDAKVGELSARLDALLAGSRPEQIAAARAGVDEAVAALENAEQELKRKRTMAEGDAASRRELDAAEAARDRAQAALDGARASLDLAIEGPREEDIAAMRAALGVAQAERERAALQVEDATLRAPADGILRVRAREPGSMVQPGQPVMTLTLSDRVDVRAYVAEPSLGRVPPGTEVAVTTDSSTRRYRGRVGFVSPRAEFTPKTVETPELRTDLVYRLRIVVEDGDDGLVQGMPVTIEVPGSGS